ncbi:MAG: glycosyltransferase family 2 protein [Syntrophobacteraceae bacterium]
MSKIQVSIIIPTYNRALRLTKALDSIVLQWNDLYELIVVDDGSTDNTKSIIEDYSKRIDIKYIYQDNSGKPASARNTGIKHAKGDYVCFLDSDDILAKGSIEKRRRFLSEHEDVAMIYGDWMDMFTDSSGILLQQSPSWVVLEGFLDKIPGYFIEMGNDNLITFNPSIVNMIFTREFIVTSCVMVRKAVLDRVGYFDENFTISEDRDLWIRVCIDYYTAYIKDVLVYKYRHNDNITNTSVAFNYHQDCQCIEKLLMNSNILNGPHKRIAQMSLAEFYGKIGRYFWYRDDLTSAKLYLKKAMTYKPMRLSTYVYGLFSCFPHNVTMRVKSFKRFLSRVIGT